MNKKRIVKELKKIADQLIRSKVAFRYLDWVEPPEEGEDIMEVAGWQLLLAYGETGETLAGSEMQEELTKFGLEMVFAYSDEEVLYWRIAKKGEQFTQPY